MDPVDRRQRAAGAACWLAAASLLLVLGGCSGLVPRVDDAPGSKAPGVSEVPEGGARKGDLSAPPRSQWQGEAETAPGGERARRLEAPRSPGPGPGLYSQDSGDLQEQVAAICQASRSTREPVALSSLVSDLYTSGVEPAEAAEALILGGCASPEAIVLELVAQGGYSVVDAVTSRALLLGGAETERGIAAAVAAGLDRAIRTPDASVSAQDGFPYAMAYFSARSSAAALAGADALNVLYDDATPGFGLYTFVLLGAGFSKQEPAQVRAGELLRVIETYVPGDGSGSPSPEAHAFLIAVHPERAGLPLGDQTGPELSDPVRRRLATEVRRLGLGVLARRLETRPGPFLVTSPEPRLIPQGSGSPRLVTDLSGMGKAYLYGVVDALDRPVPPGANGVGLGAIQQRLLALPRGDDPGGAAGGTWVFRVGRVAPQRVAR